jgi:hypothetical protein
MNKREKILAAIVGGLVAVWAGNWFYGRYDRALEKRRAAVRDAETGLADANLKLAEARRAIQHMETWREQSLPSNREKALSLYKAWLLEKAKASGVAVNDIKLAPTTTVSPAFKAIGYQIEASGSLSSVIGMLYEFYRSPQLHQITRLRLNRPPGATQLQVTLEVEALSLPGATATDKLPEGDAKRLKLATLAEYQKTFGERDLASVYTPPKPSGPPPSERRAPPAPPKFDEAELAHFTGTVGYGKNMQAWINVRSTGETLHVQAGDPVKIGALEGHIESIDARSIVLKIGDKRFRVPLGESLRNGKELGASAEATSGHAEPSKS